MKRRGYSLIELLVVIGIMTLLLAILLPVVGRVRKMAHSTKCLANLQQWGQSCQMYLNGNRGRFFADRQDLTGLTWYELLQPYNGSVEKTLLCPEASDPGNQVGSASLAWGPIRTYNSAQPSWQVRGTFVGSYGFNSWLFEHLRQSLPQWWRDRTIALPATQSDRIPVLADCALEWAMPQDTDTPGDLQTPLAPAQPGSQGKPGALQFMRVYCIDRHDRAVNVLFVDGHAERVPLAQLWKLKWNNVFTPREVTIP